MKIQNSLKHLFVSQTRIKIISVLFYHPGEIYYVRQLVRLVDEEINSVRRELDNLQKSGLNVTLSGNISWNYINTTNTTKGNIWLIFWRVLFRY